VTRVVCIGECMVEFAALPDGRYERAFAGDAYNTAVYLKRCDPAAEVRFATVTGDDAVSGLMRQAWDAEGIDASLAFTAPGLSPGLYVIDTGAGGERRFAYWRGQSAARGWLAPLEGAVEAIAGADLVYFSGISLAILPPDARGRALELIDRLKPRVGAIAFDPNVRPPLWESTQAMSEIIEGAVSRAAIVLPSADDAERLWGGADSDSHVGRLLALGAEEIALTLGARGCILGGRGRAPLTLAAPAVTAVDTSGAGDAFNGAYLAARLGGAGPEAAARAGIALAARVVTARGALVGQGERG
jgi:2-dehydro-3-deoxygluconokinase